MVNLESFLHGYSLDSHKFFGAHKIDDEYVFRVYAPNAKEVEIKGSFTNWQTHKMNKISYTGIYEARFNNVKEYDSYLYNILTKDNRWIEKVDPYGFLMERRPMHNSRVFDVEDYPWHDEKWMKKRTKNFDEPMSIYELHIGSFVKIQGEEFIDYERLAPVLCKHLKEHKYTHVELMPILEHPVDESWGYQVTGFYSVTSRYGNPKQLMYLVDYLHEHGIGVIMDFVSVHFACDSYGLLDFDGEQVYGYNHDLKYSQWGSPSFDLGRDPVRSYLLSCVSYFLEYFHFDGVRFDAVSNMIYYDGDSSRGVNEGALEFIKRMNSLIKERYPSVMLIAEDSTSYPNVCGDVNYNNSLGYDYKWDLGWMNDTLKYFSLDPIYRKDNHNLITFSMHYYFSERFLLPLSHDEVVHGKKSIINKMWGSYDDKFKQARLLYTYMYTHPGKKLSFMGNEIAQFIEWNYKRELDWFLLDYPIHNQFNQFIKDLNKLYVSEKPMYKEDYTDNGFKWMMVDNKRQSVFTYYRKYRNEYLVVVLNMTPVSYDRYEIGVPEYGYYEEMLNSDDIKYGGNTTLSGDYYISKKKKLHGQENVITIKLGSFGAIVFRRMKNV